jgi:hypothetical protein
MRIQERIQRISLCILISAASMTLGAGCTKANKKPTAPPSAGNHSDLVEATDPVFNARVQAISRKNQILTLKFPDEKVAKVRVRGTVRNFSEIGVGDAIKAKFADDVEVFPVAPTGKPLWNEIQEIKKTPRGTRPGTPVIKPYEYASMVTAIDYGARKITLKGPEGRPIRITAKSELTRFNEIKAGDQVVARFTEATSIDITPAPRVSSAVRPSRRR